MRGTDRRKLVAGLAVALVALQPFWTFLPLYRNLTPGAPVGAFDVLLLVLIALSLPDLGRAVRRPPDLASRLATVLLGLVVVALVVHPTAAGALSVARLCGATCLWLALRRMTSPEARRLIVGALLALAALESVIAVAQIVLRRPVGGGILTAATWPMNILAGTVAPRGTFQHQFPLAAFALLATFAGLALLPTLGSRTEWRVAVFLAVAAVPLGITFSRSAVLGVVLAVATTVLLVRPRTGTVALGIGAIVVGAIVPGLVWRGGWRNRIETGAAAVAAGDPNLFTSSRLELAHGAVELVRAHPAFGIGPGRFTPGSAEAARVAPKFPDEIVHDLPLFFAVEAGLPAGVLAGVILVGFGAVTVRRSPAAFALFVAVLPFVLIDRLSYDGAHGLAFTAIWLALVEILAGPRGEPSPSRQSMPAAQDAAY